MRRLCFFLSLLMLSASAHAIGVSDGGGEEGGPVNNLWCEFHIKDAIRITFVIEQNVAETGFAGPKIIRFNKFINDKDAGSLKMAVKSQASFLESKTEEGLLTIVLIYTGRNNTEITLDPNGKYNADLPGRQFEFSGVISSENSFLESPKSVHFYCTVNH